MTNCFVIYGIYYLHQESAFSEEYRQFFLIGIGCYGECIEIIVIQTTYLFLNFMVQNQRLDNDTLQCSSLRTCSNYAKEGKNNFFIFAVTL